MSTRNSTARLAVLGLILFAAGCAAPRPAPAPRPSVAPATQPSAVLQIGAVRIEAMYREMLPVDLPTVLRVGMARNLDIQQARMRVEAAKGRYESSVGAIFPVIAPTLAWQHFEGTNQNANGTLVSANFSDLLPSIAMQWILNPGRVVYDIVAARRRMDASEDLQDAVRLEAARQAAVQYYELVLAQAQLGVSRQAMLEAEELVRITRLKVKAGTGLPADELRAVATLARLEQDVALALNRFNQASVALTLTLHIDPTITLVPSVESVNQLALVSDDLPIDALLGIAVKFRPDLAAVRAQLGAAQADVGAVAWGAVGPQAQASYTYGGIQADAGTRTFGMHQQQKTTLSAGFALSMSAFGQVRTAKALEKLAGLDLQRQMDQVRAAVVSNQQNSITTAKLIPAARRQLDAAEQALKLAQANLRAGTMLTIDVLQAQAEAETARGRFIDAVVHYNQAQVNLLASLGLLTPQTLGVGK